MTAANKVIWATILATRVSKVDKEVNPDHGVVTRETRVNKAVLAAAANKGKEARRIVEARIVETSKDSKVRKEKFPPIAALLH
jgi:hypothetical protein